MKKQGNKIEEKNDDEGFIVEAAPVKLNNLTKKNLTN